VYLDVTKDKIIIVFVPHLTKKSNEREIFYLKPEHVHQPQHSAATAKTEVTKERRQGRWHFIFHKRNTDAGWQLVPKCLLTCLWLGIE